MTTAVWQCEPRFHGRRLAVKAQGGGGALWLVTTAAWRCEPRSHGRNNNKKAAGGPVAGANAQCRRAPSTRVFGVVSFWARSIFFYFAVVYRRSCMRSGAGGAAAAGCRRRRKRKAGGGRGAPRAAQCGVRARAAVLWLRLALRRWAHAFGDSSRGARRAGRWWSGVVRAC